MFNIAACLFILKQISERVQNICVNSENVNVSKLFCFIEVKTKWQIVCGNYEFLHLMRSIIYILTQNVEFGI